MQVSRAWFYMWVTDRMWAQHRRRICVGNPELVRLFEEHSDASGDGGEHESKRSKKSNSNSKRKTPWIMPKQGTWYVFRRWLSKGMSMRALKTLPRHLWQTSAVLTAVVRSHLPNPDGWGPLEVTYNVKPLTISAPRVFQIRAWYRMPGLDSMGHRIICYVHHCAENWMWEFHDVIRGTEEWRWQIFSAAADFEEWRAWILWPHKPQHYIGPCWQPEFAVRFE